MATGIVINVSAQFTKPLFDEIDDWRAKAAALRATAATTDDTAQKSELETDAADCDRKGDRIEETAVALLAAEGITGADAFAQKTVEVTGEDGGR